jgi:hypothetical protein
MTPTFYFGVQNSLGHAKVFFEIYRQFGHAASNDPPLLLQNMKQLCL